VAVRGQGRALGSLTMACVMPVSWAPELRKLLGVARVCSGKVSVWSGWSMVNGMMPMFGILGPAAAEPAVPWATIVVPCGIEASRVLKPLPVHLPTRQASRAWGLSFAGARTRRSAVPASPVPTATSAHQTIISN
jgi:hypothetical protein